MNPLDNTMIEFHLNQFSGPLELLLSLVQDQKFSISELAISEVTEQYLLYLDTLEQEKPDEMADFLVVATRLLLLKSKTLLPQFFPEEEEGPTLEEQLKLYKLFVDASKHVAKAWGAIPLIAFRVEPPQVSTEVVVPQQVTGDSLHQSMVQLLYRLAPAKPLPEFRIDKTVSIKQKIDQIRSLLKTKKHVRFQDILAEANNRTEVIVGFLALLELVKQKVVLLKQQDTFGDIFLTQV